MRVIQDSQLLKSITVAILGIASGMVTVIWVFNNSNKVKAVMYPLLISFLIAYLLNQPVKAFEYRVGDRLKTVAIIYSLTLIIIFLLGWLTIPRLINDLAKMVSNMPRQMQEMQQSLDIINKYTAQILPENHNISHMLLTKLSSYWQSLIWKLFSHLTADGDNLIKQLLIIIYVPVLVFFMLLDFDNLKLSIKTNLPADVVLEISAIKRRLNYILFGWFRGQLIVCTIIGILVYLGLSLIGIQQKFFLALFSGFTNLIPYFGPIIGALPAVAAAFSDNSGMVIKVILLYTLIQQIEGNIISPQVFGDRIGLSPAWILVSLGIGGKVGGVVGLIIAVPIAGMIKSILDYLGGRKIRYLKEEDSL